MTVDVSIARGWLERGYPAKRVSSLSRFPNGLFTCFRASGSNGIKLSAIQPDWLVEKPYAPTSP
jgi:hypothetical protein